MMTTVTNYVQSRVMEENPTVKDVALQAALADEAKPGEMPAIAQEIFKAPSESLTILARGGSLALIGAYTGHLIGNMTDHCQINRPQAYKGLGSKVLSWGLGGAGAILGAYSASQEVREAKRQFANLQEGLVNVHERNAQLVEKNDILRAGLKLNLQEPSRNGSPKPHVVAATIEQDRVKESDLQRA